jgi:hypothetical protein
MTKRKKHKKRVRALMEETGTNYTNANSTLSPEQGGPDADKVAWLVVGQLRKAKKVGVGAVMEVLEEFHNAYGTPEGTTEAQWRASMGSTVIDRLWGGGSEEMQSHVIRRALKLWMEKGPETQTAEHSTQMAKHLKMLAYPEGPQFKNRLGPDKKPAPTYSSEDDAWYDGSRPFVALTPEELGGLTEQQVLMHLWEYAPKVPAWFQAAPKLYRNSRTEVGGMVRGAARENRTEQLEEIRQGGSTVIDKRATPTVTRNTPAWRREPTGGDVVLKGSSTWEPDRGGQIILNPHGPTPQDEDYYEFGPEGGPQPQASLHDPEAVDLSHTLGSAGEHERIAAELEEKETELARLRAKLRDAGIDPDA